MAITKGAGIVKRYTDTILTGQKKTDFLKKQLMDHRCPRKLKHLPTENCDWGARGFWIEQGFFAEQTYPAGEVAPQQEAAGESLKKSYHEHSCPWFVHDAESHYCFWAMMALHDDKEHSLDEIAKLTCSNISTVNSIQQKGLTLFKGKARPTWGMKGDVKPEDDDSDGNP